MQQFVQQIAGLISELESHLFRSKYRYKKSNTVQLLQQALLAIES